MFTIRKKAVTTALCGGVAAFSLLPMTAADAGESTYRGCKAGNVCVYRNPDAAPVDQTAGNLPDGTWGWEIVNNGHRDPGSDHVRFQYKHNESSESWQWECLHYYPGSGFKLDVSDDVTPIRIKNMSWGGEC